MQQKNKQKRSPSKIMKTTENDLQITTTSSDSDETLYFRFSNKAIKYLKAGGSFEKTFVKGGKKVTMKFIHDDNFKA